MPSTSDMSYIAAGPIVGYLGSLLIWSTVSVGSGLLLVWHFIDSTYQVPNPFASYQNVLPALIKPTISLPQCEKSISDTLQQKPINFKTGNARLTPQDTQVIGQIAELLHPCQHATIAIQGHTDSVGSAQKNMSLSVRRAESVAQALKQLGFAESKFSVTGAGESQPIASNDTPEGRFQNRRIEIRLYE